MDAYRRERFVEYRSPRRIGNITVLGYSLYFTRDKKQTNRLELLAICKNNRKSSRPYSYQAPLYTSHYFSFVSYSRSVQSIINVGCAPCRWSYTALDFTNKGLVDGSSRECSWKDGEVRYNYRISLLDWL